MVKLNEYVENIPGHKNSEGKSAPWVVKSHETGEIISSHTSKADAEEHLKQMSYYGSKKNKKESILQELLDSDTSDIEESNVSSSIRNDMKDRVYRSLLTIPGTTDRFKVSFDYFGRREGAKDESSLLFDFKAVFGKEYNIQSTYELRAQPRKVMFKLFTWIANKFKELISVLPNVDVVHFSAKSGDRGRIAIYRRFAKMIGQVKEHEEGGFVEFEVHRNTNQSLVEEFLRSYLGEDIGGIGGVGQSTNFQAQAPEHMLGKPITLNRPKRKKNKHELTYDQKPFPGVK